MPESFPYGYRYTLVPYEPEHEVVRRIGDMYFKDRLSQHEIVRILNKEGVTCRGRPWHQGTISKILSREFQAELRQRRAKLVKHGPPPKPSWREQLRSRSITE